MAKRVLTPGKEPSAEFVQTRERVMREATRFRDALPELLKKLANKWVVFHDGAVVSVHDTMARAYRDGLARFGLHGGHVVAAVRDAEEGDAQLNSLG